MRSALDISASSRSISRLLVLLSAGFFLCAGQAAFAVVATVLAVNSPTADATYKIGDAIDITVQFSEAVTVDTTGGTPALALNSGGTATYLSGTTSDTLTFRYTVLSSESASDLDYSATTSLTNGGGTILDTATGMDAADLTLAAPGGFAAAHAIVVDGIAPSITSVAVPADATYGIGQNLDFTVNFDDTVTVDTTGGTPRIGVTMDTGGTVYASYLSGTGTAALVFRYTVAEGVLDSTGIALAANIDANSGTLRDSVGNDANPALNSVGDTTHVFVDGVRPTVVAVDSTTPDGTYKIGDTIHVTVTFTEAITVVVGGTPTIGLQGTDQAFYASGSGTATLTFDYTVVAGNSSADLNYAGTTSLYLNGGSFRDAVGNDASLTLPATGAANSLGGNRDIVIDGVRPVVSSINRQSPAAATTNATSVTYQVTFAESVTGVDVTDFTLTTTGTASGTVFSVSAASGTTFDVVVNSITGDGSLRLDLTVGGTGIADAVGNGIVTGYSGQTYTIDNTGPVSTSVDVPASRTYIASNCCLYFIIFDYLDFVVHFDSPVFVSGGFPLGTAYFDLNVGGVSKEVVYSSGSGTNALTFHWVAEAGDSDTDGVVVGSLHTPPGSSLQDAVGNNAALTLNSVGDTSAVLVDGIIPTVVSINRVGANPTNASSVDYTVTFSEDVTHVDASDFSLTATGTAAGTVASVTPVSASVYTVTVNSITGAGTLRLDLNAVPTTGITDTPGNPILTAFSSGQTYTIDAAAPSVSSIARNYPSAAITNATIVNPRITFSEDVSGVDVSDFSLTLTGTATGTIALVTAESASSYVVRIEGISGNGTLRLDLNSSGTGIVDTASNAVSGGFTSGEIYTIDQTSPAGVSINRADTDPTTAASVDYTVSFSETVTGVDVSDFVLGHSGSANGVIATVTPVSGSVYTVTVNSLVGSGTLRLDLDAGATIGDPAGNGISGGLTGQIYTVTPAIDVRVGFTRDMSSANEGNPIVYTFTVVNNGPGTATGVGVQLTPPGTLTSAAWSCTNGTGGATCPNASGMGAINETVNMPSGGSLIYMLSGTVGETEGNALSLTVTVVPPTGVHDLSHAEDSETYTLPVGVYINGFEDN